MTGRQRRHEGRLFFYGLIWRNEVGYWHRYLVRRYDGSKRWVVQELVFCSLSRTPKRL